MNRTADKDRWLALALRIVLLGTFLLMIRTLLMAIVLGGLFALLLDPLQHRLRDRAPKLKAWSATILTAGATFLFLIPLALMVVQGVRSLNQLLSGDWMHTIEQVQAFVAAKTGWVAEHFGLDPAGVQTSASDTLRDLGGQVGALAAGSAASMAKSLPDLLVDFFIVVSALYYFLRDGDRLADWATRMSPFPSKDTRELFQSVKETVNGAVFGTVVTAGIQGALTMGSLYVFKVPGAFIFGVLATLFAFIPMIGTTPITVGATIFLFSTGRTGAAVGMIVAAVVIGLSDNVIRPLAQSSHSSMHPLMVLLGIFGGLELFGPAGVLLGPIVAAMAVWTIDTYAHLRTRQRARDSLASPSLPPISIPPDPPVEPPAEPPQRPVA